HISAHIMATSIRLEYQILFQRISPGAKTFGLARSVADTPKDFAPTRYWRDRSGVAILRNTAAISPNRNAASVANRLRTSALHLSFDMRPRCVQLARVLKKTGSFYYHCDRHASH